INIPQAEVEKLGIQKGDGVQVFLTPLDKEPKEEYGCPDCRNVFATRKELLTHECSELGQRWGDM
ncbi:MAG: hypothetical protein ABEI86_07985, partial [Halobacteriaceae archaeon]